MSKDHITETNMEASGLHFESSEILAAAAEGDIERIQTLVRKRNYVKEDCLSHTKRTAVGCAALNDQYECVEFLIRIGADVNGRGGNGETPLITAAINGHHKTVEVLIKSGADVNASIENYYTTAIRAVKKEKMSRDILSVIGSEFYYPPINEGETALILAAQNGYDKCVDLLIKAGADVNVADVCGRTPLIATASVPDRLAIVADKHLYGNSRRLRPLASKLKCVQLLLKAGARVNIIYEHGLNALQCHLVFSECNDRRLVKMLLYAAGETIDGTTVIRKGYWGDAIGYVHIPEYLHQGEVKLESLRYTCRKVIRKHLIDLDPHTNLFGRIPQLELPSSLYDYLLYDMTLNFPADFD